MKDKAGFSLLATIIIIVVTGVISSIATGVILYNGYKDKLGVTYDKLSNDTALREFLDVYSSLTGDYYKDIDKKAMLKKAIEAMTEYLGDKYTTYLTEDQKTHNCNDVENKYRSYCNTNKQKNE